jgi:hypothetical protein
MNRRTALKNTIAAILGLSVGTKVAYGEQNRQLVPIEFIENLRDTGNLKDFYIPDFYLIWKEINGVKVWEVEKNYLVFTESKDGKRYACLPKKDLFPSMDLQTLAKQTPYFKRVPLKEKYAFEGIRNE